MFEKCGRVGWKFVHLNEYVICLQNGFPLEMVGWFAQEMDCICFTLGKSNMFFIVCLYTHPLQAIDSPFMAVVCIIQEYVDSD